MYDEDEYLMLSGIQHFGFCKRQWCLIHIEQQWNENQWTAEGQILHEKADNPYIKEKRKDTFFSRAMPVSSASLGLYGILDVVEFIRDDNGLVIHGKSGRWKPNIVEFKRGKRKKDDRDILQLAAQTICLEESLKVEIPYSYIYYHQTKTKQLIHIDEQLRRKVKLVANEMHKLYKAKTTLEAEYNKNCKECSLVNICMPRLTKKKVNIENYISKHVFEDEI
ncbi:CRISPR-associated protein Cas4 [Macrococcus capreoli]